MAKLKTGREYTILYCGSLDIWRRTKNGKLELGVELQPEEVRELIDILVKDQYGIKNFHDWIKSNFSHQKSKV